MSLVAGRKPHHGVLGLEKKLKQELSEKLSSIQVELIARRIGAEDAELRVAAAKIAYDKRLAAIRLHPRRWYWRLIAASTIGAVVTIGATLRLFPKEESVMLTCYVASLVSLAMVGLVQMRELRRLRLRAAGCLGRGHAALVLDAPLARFTCAPTELSVLATEVRNHHALASVLDDEALAELSGNLLDYLTEHVTRSGGVVLSAGHNAYLAVFTERDHARTAVDCARHMQGELAHAPSLIAANGRAAHLGMGISTGQAQLGVVGLKGLQRFVCEGRTAELARELAAAAAWGEVLLAEDLSSRLEGDVKLEPREPLRSIVSDSIVRIHCVVLPPEVDAR